MNLNVFPSDQIAVLDLMDPVSQAAATVVSAWVPVTNCDAIMAILSTGVMGANGTIDAKLRQATSAAGANAKDITGKAITQILKATGDNVQAVINCRSDEVDVNGGFTHVALSVTVGTAASLMAAMLLGINARYQPVAQPAAVVEVIS